MDLCSFSGVWDLWSSGAVSQVCHESEQGFEVCIGRELLDLPSPLAAGIFPFDFPKHVGFWCPASNTANHHLNHWDWAPDLQIAG